MEKLEEVFELSDRDLQYVAGGDVCCDVVLEGRDSDGDGTLDQFRIRILTDTCSVC